MSFGVPMAASCRANTTSTPMSFASEVSTLVSLASPSAGSDGESSPGNRNSDAISCASVALPPLPNVSSRPPTANRAVMCRAHEASSSLDRALTSVRSSMISRVLVTVDSLACANT